MTTYRDVCATARGWQYGVSAVFFLSCAYCFFHLSSTHGFFFWAFIGMLGLMIWGLGEAVFVNYLEPKLKKVEELTRLHAVLREKHDAALSELAVIGGCLYNKSVLQSENFTPVPHFDREMYTIGFLINRRTLVESYCAPIYAMYHDLNDFYVGVLDTCIKTPLTVKSFRVQYERLHHAHTWFELVFFGQYHCFENHLLFGLVHDYATTRTDHAWFYCIALEGARHPEWKTIHWKHEYDNLTNALQTLSMQHDSVFEQTPCDPQRFKRIHESNLDRCIECVGQIDQARLIQVRTQFYEASPVEQPRALAVLLDEWLAIWMRYPPLRLRSVTPHVLEVVIR